MIPAEHKVAYGPVYALMKCPDCGNWYAAVKDPAQQSVLYFFLADNLESPPTHAVIGGARCLMGRVLDLVMRLAVPVEGGWLDVSDRFPPAEVGWNWRGQ